MAIVLTILIASGVLYMLVFGVPDRLTDWLTRARLYLTWKRHRRALWKDIESIRKEDYIP